MFFLLISVVSSVEEICLNYQCKPNSMIFKPSTCLYIKSSTAYVSSCEDSEYCPKVTQGNSTCILKPTPSEEKGFPGEACSRDRDCLYPNCQKGTCVGKHWLESCEASFECDVGLYCNQEKICWVQKEEYSRCNRDSECKNNMACNFWTNSYEGECRRYFSLKNKEWVFNCEDHNSLLCHSGNCGGPGGKGVCIDGIKPRYLDPSCESNEDCPGESYGWQFYSSCDCGLNSKGKGFCRPFLGDYLGKEYIEMVKKWYDSNEIHTCHTDLRESSKCLSKWKDYEKYLVKYYEWRYYAALQENSDCIKKTFNSFYWDLKEEEHKPPPEPVKPPSIFGGLAVKTPVPKPVVKNVQSSPVVQMNEGKTETVKTFKDPFEDLLGETPKAFNFNTLGPTEANVWNDVKEHPQSGDTGKDLKKNDPNSIEFLLDLTMGDAKSSQNPAPVVIKKANVIRNEVSSELRKGNVGRNFESSEDGQGNLFSGISNVRTAQRINELRKNNEKVNENLEKEKKVYSEQGKNKKKSRDSSGSEKKKKITTKNETEAKQLSEKKEESLEKSPKINQSSEEAVKTSLLLKAEEEKAIQEAFSKLQEQEALARKERDQKEALLLQEQEEFLRKQELDRLDLERKSLEQRLNSDFILNTFEENLSSLQKSIEKLSSDQQTLKDVQKNYQADLQVMQEKEKELENLASEAANSEDFDLAVNYSDERESLLLKIEFTLKDLEKKSEEFLTMEVEKSKLYQEVRNLFIRTEDSLKNIIDTCTFDLELKKSSLVTFSENFENNNKNFSKEIEKKNEEVFNLQEGLKEKKEEVQEKVKNRSEPLKEEKEKTENSLESVLKEIEEITKLLNEKIASKDLLSDKLKLIENELNGVDDEFFDDFQEIQAAEDLIRVETSELEALLITSSNEKQKNQKEIEDCSQIIEKITEKLIKTVEVHQSFEERFKSIQNQIETRESSLSEVLKNKESLKSSKEKLSNCEKTLKTLTQEINSYQDELKQQESRIDEIKLKLPIMESEKKQATSNKLFKEAAKINNEIKEMTNELQSLLESSESLNISLLEKKSEDESLRESLLKHREELESLNEKIEKLSNFTSLDN